MILYRAAQQEKKKLVSTKELFEKQSLEEIKQGYYEDIAQRLMHKNPIF